MEKFPPTLLFGTPVIFGALENKCCFSTSYSAFKFSRGNSAFYCRTSKLFWPTKDQKILKAINGVLNSSKKQTKITTYQEHLLFSDFLFIFWKNWLENLPGKGQKSKWSWAKFNYNVSIKAHFLIWSYQACNYLQLQIGNMHVY